MPPKAKKGGDQPKKSKNTVEDKVSVSCFPLSPPVKMVFVCGCPWGIISADI